MSTILDVTAIFRQEKSRTRKLHDAFKKAYDEAHPGTTWIDVDTAHDYDEFPSIDVWDIQAKLEVMYGDGTLDETTAERWNALSKLTDQLHSADIIVVSAPMWNLSVPWQMKRWLDCVVQANLTFEIRPEGFVGLLSGRRGVILATRDGDFGPGSPTAFLDYQIPYLKGIFGLMGVDPVTSVVAEALSPHDKEQEKRNLDKAIAQAVELARSL